MNAGTFANTTTILPPAMPRVLPSAMPPLPAPAPVFQPLSTAFTGVTVAAPNVRLAGPAIRSISSRYGDSVGSTVTQDYVGTTGVYQPKPLVLRSAPAPKSQIVVIERDHYAPSAQPVSTHSHSSGHSHDSGFVAPLRQSSQGGGIYAETVNINYGNNSQVGTTSSNNGSTVGGAGHSHHGAYTSAYSVPSAPIDFGDGIGDGTWGNGVPVSSSVNTGSYSVGSASAFSGYSNKMPVYSSSSSRYTDSASSYSAPLAPIAAPSPTAGQGGSYFVGSGQSFQAPSAAEFNANCAAGSAGCGASAAAPSYNWSASSYDVQTPSYSHSQPSGGYSYCDSDEVYNENGSLVVGGSPYCR